MLLEAGAEPRRRRVRLPCRRALPRGGARAAARVRRGPQPDRRLGQHAAVLPAALLGRRAQEQVGQGLRWLLDHGADPNVPCGRQQEPRCTWRRGAARRPRSCGCCSTTAPTSTPAAATGAARGCSPRTAATRRSRPCSRRRAPSARTCLAAGFPVDEVDENGATALHHAALRGDAAAVRRLLARGADRRREDPQHHATPLGWAEFGRDQAIAPDGDYEACIRALSTAG